MIKCDAFVSFEKVIDLDFVNNEPENFFMFNIILYCVLLRRPLNIFQL